MSQAIKNIIRGDSRTINVTILQSDGITPFNLAGCKVYFTVNAADDNTADTDTSAAIAITQSSFVNPASGVATFQLTNAITQDLAAGTYNYDVQLRDTSGNISSLPRGIFTVVADVTRSVA